MRTKRENRFASSPRKHMVCRTDRCWRRWLRSVCVAQVDRFVGTEFSSTLIWRQHNTEPSSEPDAALFTLIQSDYFLGGNLSFAPIGTGSLNSP